MELLTKLPVGDGECIRSYVIRLALANDYDTVIRFFNETSDIKTVRINSSQASIVELVKLIDVNLSQHSFLPATQIIKGAVGIESMMHDKPKVCPHCVAEKNIIEAKWQLLQVTHCDIHHCELISHCHCGEPFEWCENLLKYGCSHCYSPWNEIAGQTKTKPLPAHVNHFSLLQFDAREAFLEDMMTAAIRALRPFDSVHHKIKQLRHCEVNWTDLMVQSFNMLTDKTTITQWIESLAFKRNHYQALGDSSVFYPIVTLKERLHSDWLVKGYKLKLSTVSPCARLLSSHNLTSCNARNSSALNESSKAKTETQLINQVDQVAFVKMTGVNIKIARNIFKMESINALSKVGRGRYALIDIDSFVNKLALINSLPRVNTVAISQLEGLLSTFGLSFEEGIIEALDSNFPVYLNPNAPDFISSFQVNELQFSEYLETDYIKRNNFSLTHAAILLEMPVDKVKYLARINLIKEVPTPKKKHLYSGASISVFLAQYECLERWASIHDLCLDKLYKEALLQGIEPVIRPFVFEKNTALDNLLAESHERQWHQPEQLSLVM